MEFIQKIDVYTYDFFKTSHSSYLDNFFNIMKIFGDGYIILLPFFIYLYLSDRSKFKYAFYHYLILAMILTIIKIILQKYRPILYPLYGYNWFSSIKMNHNQMSGISGDVVNVLFISYYLKNIVPNFLLFFIIASVSLGRMYFQGHYIIDVILSYVLFYISLTNGFKKIITFFVR